MKDLRRILVIDGNFLKYRTYFAFNKNPLKIERDDKILRSSIIVGFLNELIRIENTIEHDYICITWDKYPYWKSNIYPEYKANRHKTKIEDVSEEILILKTLLNDLGIPSFSLRSFEGEEIANSIIKRHKKKHVDLVTNDDDCLMLLSKHVNIINLKDHELNIITKNSFIKEYGIKPKQFLTVKTLAGCKSDNVPGVNGIGMVKAIAITKEYSSLKELKYDASRASKFLSPAKHENLLNSIQHLDTMKKLVTIKAPNGIEIYRPDVEVNYKQILEYLDARSFMNGTKKQKLKNFKKKFKPKMEKFIKKSNAFITVND